MMHPIRITMGPAIANIVDFRCTIVPMRNTGMRGGMQAERRGVTRADRDITLELDILANDSFGVKGELVASE